MAESTFAYKMMVWMHRIGDLFHKPGKQLHTFGIQKGDTLVDYGCGPGRYLETAARLVGLEGRVYAVDINPIAIANVEKRIKKNGLENVIPIMAGNGASGIPDDCADVVYALGNH